MMRFQFRGDHLLLIKTSYIQSSSELLTWPESGYREKSKYYNINNIAHNIEFLISSEISRYIQYSNIASFTGANWTLRMRWSTVHSVKNSDH